jgi:hypothetical protein
LVKSEGDLKMSDVERISTDAAPKPAGHYSQACA